MRRTTAIAAVSLVLLALTARPIAAAPAGSTTTTSTTTLPHDATATTSTTASTTTTTSAPATTTTAARTKRRAPVARAHAAPSVTVSIATSGPNCSTFCFSPAQTTIAAGTTVTFTNPSGADHTVKRCTPAACNGASGGTGNDPQFLSTTIALPPNASYSLALSQPGTYVFYCTIHGYALMHGTITVAAAAPTTTVSPTSPAPAPSPSPTTSPDANALASTGGTPDPLVAIAGGLLVVGLAAMGVSRRRTEQ